MGSSIVKVVPAFRGELPRDLAAVHFDEGFDDAQTQSQTAAVEFERAGGMVQHVEAREKRIEYVRQIFGIDADAVIDDPGSRPGCLPFRGCLPFA